VHTKCGQTPRSRRSMFDGYLKCLSLTVDQLKLKTVTLLSVRHSIGIAFYISYDVNPAYKDAIEVQYGAAFRNKLPSVVT